MRYFIIEGGQFDEKFVLKETAAGGWIYNIGWTINKNFFPWSKIIKIIWSMVWCMYDWITSVHVTIWYTYTNSSNHNVSDITVRGHLRGKWWMDWTAYIMKSSITKYSRHTHGFTLILNVRTFSSHVFYTFKWNCQYVFGFFHCLVCEW